MTARQEAATVVSITVTFNPRQDVLEKQVRLLLPQVERVVIVDNGSAWSAEDIQAIRGLGDRIEIIPLEENRGVAAAQNIGIERARNHGAAFVALFDQDSRPAPDLVPGLLRAHDRLKAQGLPVAAVGPRYIDPGQNNPSPFAYVKGMRRIRFKESNGAGIVPVDHLISSGSLIPMPVFAVVGKMNEALFIDYVDIEWCLRARYFGYLPYGVFDVRMEHAIGDKPFRLWGQTIRLHSPERYYYQFRNALWLYRRPWTSLGWLLMDAWRHLIRFMVYATMTPPRPQNMKMMALGLWHGCRGRLGPLS